MRRRLSLIAALAATLAGCSGFGGDSAPTPAAVVAPEPAAAAPAAMPSGATLGGLLGGAVGASLGEADRQSAYDARLGALDSGQRRSWRGAKGVFGFVEPGAESGGGCRSYAETVYVGGRPQHGQGAACRQSDGAWKSQG